MRPIPLGDDGYLFDCMACPRCAQTTARMLLECPICGTHFFYTETGQPRVNILSNPMTCNKIDAARCDCDGITKTKTLAANYGRTAGMLVCRLQKWDASGASGEINVWRRARSQFGCCRLRNTRVTDRLVSRSQEQLAAGNATLKPEKWLLFFWGTFSGRRQGRSAREEGRAPRLRTRQRVRQTHRCHPPRAALTTMSNTNNATDPITHLQKLAATMAETPATVTQSPNDVDEATYPCPFSVTQCAYQMCDIRFVDPPPEAVFCWGGGLSRPRDLKLTFGRPDPAENVRQSRRKKKMRNTPNGGGEHRRCPRCVLATEATKPPPLLKKTTPRAPRHLTA